MTSFKFKNVYINDAYTVLGSLENKPSIINNVDKVFNSYYLGKNTVEEGEIKYQEEAIIGIKNRNNLKDKDIDLLIGGDLQNQLFASNNNASNFNIPFLGVYSACASFIESMIIAASLIDSRKIKRSICITSSNNLVNEKNFRFPIEYGAIRKKVNSFSSTGSVSTLLSRIKSNIKIESATIGKVITLGHTDTNDMASAMVPGVAETLYEHFKELERTPEYYDVILTGDLGVYGLFILKEYMMKKYKIKISNIEDAGQIFYNSKPDGPFAGASGPICAPIILFTKEVKKYKKILVVASGSLHSCFSSNLNREMPGIGHAISLEVNK